MSQNVAFIFIDQTNDEPRIKNNPLEQGEIDSLIHNAESIFKKTGAEKLLFKYTKFSSRNYCVELMDEDTNILAKKCGKEYRTMGAQVIQAANKKLKKRKNFATIYA